MKEQIEQLESQLTGNLLEDIEIREKIHKLKMEDSGAVGCVCELGDECVACGS